MLKKVGRLFRAKAPAGANRSGVVHELVRAEFDAVFYREWNSGLGDGDEPLLHYVNHGWREGRDPVEWFSVIDYLRDYPDVGGAGMDPFLHYLRHGRDEGRQIRFSLKSPGRHRRDFFDETGIHLAIFPDDGFEAGPYALAAGLGETDKWRALAHFVEDGLFAPRLLAAAAPSAELLKTLGEGLFKSDPDRALRCLQLAHHKGLEDPELLQELAELNLNRDQPFEAVALYRAALRKGDGNFWTHHNLALASHAIGDYAQAIVSYDRASRLWPERLGMRFKRDEVADERFWLRLAAANSLVIDGDIDAGDGEIDAAVQEYCDLVLAGADGPRKPGPAQVEGLRVAIFGPDSIPQCRLYRMQQKADQLRAAGIEADIFSHLEANKIRDQVGLYHVLLVFRMPALPEVVDVIAAARRFGVTTFYDVDDLIFDAERYPPAYESLSDVVTPIEYAGLVTGRALHRIAMELCDYGITSTPTLVEAMGKLVGRRKCFLSRNALSDIHMTALAAIASDPPVRTDRNFVIFYGSGTKTHNADLALATPGLARFLRERPAARLHVMGPVDLGPLLKGVASQIVRLPFSSDLQGYWREVAKADVNLAPLVASPFNDAKSEIKWMEAGMVGVPSIVSGSATYDELIRHGEDGFVARGPDDWYPLLSRLADERGLARRMGEATRARVLADYGLPEGSRQLLEAFTSVLPARPEQAKPRLLVVNLYYPPEYIGGATRVAEQGVNDVLARYGDEFDVRVFTGRYEDGRAGFLDHYNWNGVDVTSLGQTLDVDAIERSVATHEIFERYVDDLQPQLVHFHCVQGLSASLVDVVAERAIPYVITAHDCWWISDKQFLTDDLGALVSKTGMWGNPRRLARLHQCLEGAHATIAVSQSHGALYRSRDVSNVVVIGNGSETLPNVPWPEDDGHVWLGMLGGFHTVKGIDLLKNVLKSRRFDNLRFLAVDHRMLEGTERFELWGDNEVRIVGKTSFSTVGEVYARLHGVLAISTCFESFGLIAREAQRLGRWVVASDRGGMAEDLTDGVDGFVIDPSTVRDLLKVLSAIDADPARFRQPAPASGVHLRSPQEVTDDLVKLYREMLGTGAEGAEAAAEDAPREDQSVR